MTLFVEINDKMYENIQALKKRGGHSTLKEAVIEAFIRYDWELTEEEKGNEIISIPRRPRPRSVNNSWNKHNLRIVKKMQDK